MTLTEIKKLLYKQKPKATVEIFPIRGGDAHLNAKIIGDDMYEHYVKFVIPYSEWLDVQRNDVNNIPAQLLIRWIKM